MTELLNTRKIKEPDSKEKEILALLQKPGVEQKINSMAATLNETFSVQTRLLTDIRPGATLYDTHTKMQFIYDGAFPPFDFDPLTTVIFRKAMHPLADLDDQAYVKITIKAVNGSTYIMAMKDFIKLFAVNRFKVVDLRISDERELTKNVF